VVEGDWEREKVVIMSFPDETAFRSWADSPEYREISRNIARPLGRRRYARSPGSRN
jgi:uncharacterized protein (DUF1330 family)